MDQTGWTALERGCSRVFPYQGINRRRPALKRYRLLLSGLMFILCSSDLDRGAQSEPVAQRLGERGSRLQERETITRTDEERVKLVLSQIGLGEVKVPEDNST